MNGRHPNIDLHFHTLQELNLKFQEPCDGSLLRNYLPEVQVEGMESGDYNARKWAEFNAQKDALVLACEALCIIVNPNHSNSLKPLTQDHIDALKTIPAIAEDFYILERHPAMQKFYVDHANNNKQKHTNRFFQPTKQQVQDMYSAYREGYNYSSPPTRRW